MALVSYYIALNHDVSLSHTKPLETWAENGADYEATLSGDPVKLGYDPDGNPIYKVTLDQITDSARVLTKVNTECDTSGLGFSSKVYLDNVFFENYTISKSMPIKANTLIGNNSMRIANAVGLTGRYLSVISLASAAA